MNYTVYERNKESQERENKDRLQRAKSWYKQSGKVASGSDEQFLFLWIAFEAAYGSEVKDQISKRGKFRDFVETVITQDDEEKIKKLLQGRKQSKAILSLLKNRYIFESFWEYKRSGEEDTGWRQLLREKIQRFKNDQKQNKVIGNLCEALMRLSTLRNQIVHGAKTYGEESWGNRQLRTGCIIMQPLVGLIIEIMEKHIKQKPSTTIYGNLTYPRVEDEPQLQ